MIRVMIIDDSALVREVLRDVLGRHVDLRVIGAARDPIFGLAKMQEEWPDVVLLDLEMPRMDGLTFLRQLMHQRPTPTIICSSLTEQGMQVTLDALAAGAFSIITKPSVGLGAFLRDSEHELVTVIRAAAASRPDRLRGTAALTKPVVAPKLSADAVLTAPSSRTIAKTTDRVVALGISTGGTQALEYVLPQLPRTTPGLAIVQHMPALFTRSFAERLNALCQIEVKEAARGDRILPGRALIAPGGRHMLVKRNGAQYFVDVVDGPLVARHRPSVDVLFRSVAKAAGANALGIIMTGMGDDGSRGMREMFDAGARTLAQDAESCVVFGMPKEAIRLGGVHDVISLHEIPTAIARYGH